MHNNSMIIFTSSFKSSSSSFTIEIFFFDELPAPGTNFFFRAFADVFAGSSLTI